jgi:hypothetical protein
VPVLDLDHAESGDDDFDVGLGTMDQELKSMQELDDHYGHCQACGPTKICKITVAGTHHHLSNNQRCAWAKALVCAHLCPRSVTDTSLLGSQKEWCDTQNSSTRRCRSELVRHVLQKHAPRSHTGTADAKSVIWYDATPHDRLSLHALGASGAS